MNRRVIRAENTSSRQLLVRILQSPGSIQAIQTLPPQVLHRLIEKIGLEDSGELVALATIEQLKGLFDEDLWSNSRPGEQEQLDPARFALWLEILLEAGASFAAEKVGELDQDFVAGALSWLVIVVDFDALLLQRVDDLTQKAIETSLAQEFDRYIVIARDPEGWDAVLTLLVQLDGEHTDFLRRVLEQCCAASSDYIEDNGGLYHVLTEGERLQEDLADAREQRREKEGYVTPMAAAVFLESTRRARPEALAAQSAPAVTTRAPYGTDEPSARPDPRLMQWLEQEGVIDSPGEGLLRLAGDEADLYPEVRRSLPELETSGMAELAYLSNVLISGCSFEGRRFRPIEAAQAALAVCNFGMRVLSLKAPETQEPVKRGDWVKAFRVGFSALYHGLTLPLCAFMERRLAECAREEGLDDWGRSELMRLAGRIRFKVKEGTPWEVRENLDLLLAWFDPEVVRVLEGLFSEMPWLSPEMGGVSGFFTQPEQIASAFRWLDDRLRIVKR